MVKSHPWLWCVRGARRDVSNRFTRIVLKWLYENGSKFWNKFASILLPLIYITTGVWHWYSRIHGPERPRLAVFQCSPPTISIMKEKRRLWPFFIILRNDSREARIYAISCWSPKRNDNKSTWSAIFQLRETTVLTYYIIILPLEIRFIAFVKYSGTYVLSSNLFLTRTSGQL